jgi:predicted TPR repeat methyltransferase
MSAEQTKEISEARPWLSWICDSTSTEELREKYDSWANSYDKDVSEDWAFMSARIAETLSKLLPSLDAAILDAGAGTGLVGAALARKGYTNLTAMDLSEKMLAIAAEKQVYRSLHQGDFKNPSIFNGSAKFKAIVAAGVFANAHADAEVLNNLFRFLTEEGLFALTIREDYRNQMQTAFEQLPWQLVSEENFPVYDGEKLMYILVFKKERSL